MADTQSKADEQAEEAAPAQLPDESIVQALKLVEQRAPLAARIAHVAGAVARLPKTKTVEGQGPKFKYTPVEDMAHAITRLCGVLGVAMVPEVNPPLAWGPHRKDGTPWSEDGRKSLWVYPVAWTVTCGPGEGNTLHALTYGEAADWGDKGSNKAHTGARKYLYTMLFHLETGDDPDAVHGAADPQAASGQRGRQRAQGGDQGAATGKGAEIARRKSILLAHHHGDEPTALAMLKECGARAWGGLQYGNVWEAVEKAIAAAAQDTSAEAPQEPPDPNGGGVNYDVDEPTGEARWQQVIAAAGSEGGAKELMRDAKIPSKARLRFNSYWRTAAKAAGIEDGLADEPPAASDG